MKQKKWFIPEPFSGGHFLHLSSQALLSLRPGMINSFYSIMPTHVASNMVTQEIKAIVHMGDVRLFD